MRWLRGKVLCHQDQQSEFSPRAPHDRKEPSLSGRPLTSPYTLYVASARLPLPHYSVLDNAQLLLETTKSVIDLIQFFFYNFFSYLSV